MFVFVVIAAIATAVNGACPELDANGRVDCRNQNLTTIPQLRHGTLKA